MNENETISGLLLERVKQPVKETVIKGIPSSPGIAIGKAALLEAEKIIIPGERIPLEDIPDETARFDAAVNELTQQFLTVLKKVGEENTNVRGVLESNLLIISDSFFIDSIKKRIDSGISVESAVVQEFEKQKAYFKNSKDALLRDRAIDLQHIMERLLSVLRNRCIYYAVAEGQVIIAPSVNPTDVVNFKESGIAAIVTEVGGISSHSSILARSFEIPSVIGVKKASRVISYNSRIVVDGYSGIVIANPTSETLAKYELKKEYDKKHRQELGELIILPSETRDKKSIKLQAIVNFPEDVESAVKVGAQGVGLVRSENMLLTNKGYPGELAQAEWYTEIADRAYPHEVIIRAFDVGSDKFAAGIPRHESNPALGFRGIRFLLRRTDIFFTQIKAVLRASKNKNVKFMLPMIANLREIMQSRQLIERAKESLSRADVDFDPAMPLGIMIETPAAVLLADSLAEKSDFFSIGTNDLTQYTLAADRTNELVNEYYDDFHPAVLQMIKVTIDKASKKKIPVGICGELAGHAGATKLLIGLGIREMSVSPSAFLELKKRVLETDYREAKRFAGKILKCNSFYEVRKMLNAL